MVICWMVISVNSHDSYAFTDTVQYYTNSKSVM